KHDRLERLGTNEPACAGCGETDWRCFECPPAELIAEAPPLRCMNCQAKAEAHALDCENRERRRKKRLAKLGTNEPRCGCCGEGSWCCFEAHHVAGKRYDGATTPLCLNCHGKASDAQKDHPQSLVRKPSVQECAARLMLGHADLMSISA